MFTPMIIMGTMVTAMLIAIGIVAHAIKEGV